MSRKYPLNPKSRRFISDKRPRKWNLIAWDVRTDKEKVIRRNLSEDQWDKLAWKLDCRGFGPVYYSGRAVPINNQTYRKGGKR